MRCADRARRASRSPLARHACAPPVLGAQVRLLGAEGTPAAEGGRTRLARLVGFSCMHPHAAPWGVTSPQRLQAEVDWLGAKALRTRAGHEAGATLHTRPQHARHRAGTDTWPPQQADLSAAISRTCLAAARLYGGLAAGRILIVRGWSLGSECLGPPCLCEIHARLACHVTSLSRSGTLGRTILWGHDRAASARHVDITDITLLSTLHPLPPAPHHISGICMYALSISSLALFDSHLLLRFFSVCAACAPPRGRPNTVVRRLSTPDRKRVVGV